MGARLQTVLPRVICAFKLMGLEDCLEKAMREAFGEYYIWSATYCEGNVGFGPKKPILAVHGALHAILSSLDGQVFNRLMAASPDPDQRKRVWEWVKGLENLLQIAERASMLDGRRLNGPRRDEIRAAAQPLRRFWTSDAKRKESLFLRDGESGVKYSETVEFLYACLSLIDDSVTRRMLVDLDRSNGNC